MICSNARSAGATRLSLQGSLAYPVLRTDARTVRARLWNIREPSLKNFVRLQLIIRSKKVQASARGLLLRKPFATM